MGWDSAKIRELFEAMGMKSWVTQASRDEGVDGVADEGTTHLTYGEIERARTVFSWGGAPKPGGSKRTKKSAESGQGKKQHKSRSSAGARSGAEGSKDATERVTTS